MKNKLIAKLLNCFIATTEKNNLTMKQFNNRKSPKGFTLIELLVVIAMVGLLAALSLSLINPPEQFKKVRDAQRKQDLRQLQNALDAYNTDNNRYPAANGQQIQGAAWGNAWQPYTTKVPKDPLSPKQDYFYEVDSSGTWYRIYAKLERCPDAQTIPGADCASYNYAVTSSNTAIAIFITPGPTSTPAPTPTFTLTPTITPTLAPTPTPALSYKRVFITSQIYTANLGGLAGADAKCQTRADTAGLGGTWKAWLSDSTGSPSTRFTQSTIPYKLLDETLIANNWTDLTDGTLVEPIAETEFEGIAPTGSFFCRTTNVWTNTLSTGNANSSNEACVNWTKGSGDGSASLGWYDSTLSGWTNDCAVSDSSLCEKSAPLYCFEQ